MTAAWRKIAGERSPAIPPRQPVPARWVVVFMLIVGALPGAVSPALDPAPKGDAWLKRHERFVATARAGGGPTRRSWSGACGRLLTVAEIAAREGVEVGVFSLAELPPRFWSRANRPKAAKILLPMDAGKIERTELHALAWTGDPGDVKEYFKLNGRHFPVADGHDHHTHCTVLPVEPSLLRRGENGIEVLSDTKEHGIELLTLAPALVVRHRR